MTLIQLAQDLFKSDFITENIVAEVQYMMDSLKKFRKEKKKDHSDVIGQIKKDMGTAYIHLIHYENWLKKDGSVDFIRKRGIPNCLVEFVEDYEHNSPKQQE